MITARSLKNRSLRNKKSLEHSEALPHRTLISHLIIRTYVVRSIKNTTVSIVSITRDSQDERNTMT